MIDLKERFDELRGEELRRVPPFAVKQRHGFGYRWAFALLLVVLVVAIRRPSRTTFSEADRAAARTIASWHPPTDVLLKGAIR